MQSTFQHLRRQQFTTSLHRWLQTASGRLLVQALVFALVLQGAPLNPLLRSLSLPLALPWLQAVVPVFGPEDFLRTTGKPVTLTRTFAVVDPSGLFTLCIDNGGPHDTYSFVDSAVVTLNGREVATPSDFNETVAAVTRPVSVSLQNEVKVQLRSNPGSGFTLQIVHGTQCTGNTPLVADAGPDQTVTVGTLVSLDGSGSADAEGSPLSYQWQFTSLPPNSQATVTNAMTAQPSFVVDVPEPIP